MPEMPVDLLDDVSAVTVTNVGVTNMASLESKQSSIAQDRLDRLCKKLEEDRYILKVEIANYFMVSVVALILFLLTWLTRTRQGQFKASAFSLKQTDWSYW